MSDAVSKPETYSLGSIEFTVLSSREQTGGGFALMEFRGDEGAWTVPHVHRAMHEAFYVLAGRFVFTIAGRDVAVEPGDYLLVPPGTPHVLRAEEDAARLLTLAVPGGLEEMFMELATLGPGAITDPVVRERIAASYDSVPV